MKKILSMFLLVSPVFILIVPITDASPRIRKLHKYPEAYTSNNTYNDQSTRLPYIPPPAPVVPPVNASLKYTYYYSIGYVQGYSYSTTPTPGYYLYHTLPSTSNTQAIKIRKGDYAFSARYLPGYTYYTAPTPGYYYYFPLGSELPYAPPVYHHPSADIGNTNDSYIHTNSTYPGCSSGDILIGGQIWASCNAIDRNTGSDRKSGWFFSGERQSVYISYNVSHTALQWMGKKIRDRSWNIGPCASGYRLPTQSEWEILQSYARANESSIATLIGLPLNGGYRASRSPNGEVAIMDRLSALGTYWTSSTDRGIPLAMHLVSSYSSYPVATTDYGYLGNRQQNGSTLSGIELIPTSAGELANIRCIRN